MVSWVNLEVSCPLKIHDFIQECKKIANSLSFSPKIDKLEEYKMTLLDAKAQIEILIGDLISILQSPEIKRTTLDNILWEYLKRDLSIYLKIIDERQNELMEAHDGEPRAGIGRTIAFKGVLSVALYGIIYKSLYTSSLEYRQTPETFKVKETDEEGKEKEKEEKKTLSTFLRILFYVLSAKLSGLGGVERIRTIKSYTPPSWKGLYTQEGRKQMAKIDKEATGGEDRMGEIIDDDILFGGEFEEEPEGPEGGEDV